MTSVPPLVGIIGGSGIYAIDGLTNVRWERVLSPFGEPSDDLMFGELDGQKLVFLPRHGRGHRVPPSALNFRANIDALKRVGVTEILSISAVGSLREELAPGDFVIVDQYIDRTAGRAASFFGPGLVAHVSMADPVCTRLGTHLQATLAAQGLPYTRGGTYVAIEGPQFSTRAESRLYRAWQADVVGMTNLPEARLAREAELCYASVAMVTDYDCWHPQHDAVTVDAILRVLLGNATKAQQLVTALAPRVAGDGHGAQCACRRALDHALVTAPAARDPQMVEKLRGIAGRVLG